MSDAQILLDCSGPVLISVGRRELGAVSRMAVVWELHRSAPRLRALPDAGRRRATRGKAG